MFIQRAPDAIFACTMMKTLFTIAATAYQTLMALIYVPLKSNLSQDYAVCLFYRHFFFRMEYIKTRLNREFYELGSTLFDL